MLAPSLQLSDTINNERNRLQNQVILLYKLSFINFMLNLNIFIAYLVFISSYH